RHEHPHESEHDTPNSATQNISDPGNLLKPVEMLTTEERVKREEQDDLIEIIDEDNPQDCNDENNSEESMRDLLPRNTGTSSSMDDFKFTCKRCGLEFKYFRLLQLHKKTRKGVRCPECSQKFCSSKLLEDHLVDHAQERERIMQNRAAATNRAVNVPPQSRQKLKDCFVCNRELKVSTEENIVKFQGGTYYKCNDCINISLDTTVKKELIEDTMSRVFEGHGVFSRDDTDDNVVQQEDDMESKSETSNEGGFQCSHCKSNFGGEFALRAHRRKTVERNCPKCDMPFCNIKLLRRHMKDHEEENMKNASPPPITPQPQRATFENVVRPQRYPNRSFESDPYNRSLENFDKSFENTHIGTSSEIEIKKIGEDRYSCTKCGKNVTGKGALAAHMAHTHAEKRTICQHCGKAFAFEKILNMHLAYRQRISFPVGCRYCPHRYRNQAEVEAHEEYHLRGGGGGSGQKKLPPQMMEGNSAKASIVVGQSKEEMTHEVARSDGNILIIRKKKMCGTETMLPIVLDDKYFQGMFTEKNGLYHCNQCPNSYRARGGIKAHIYHSHRDKPYTCMYCRMPFPFEKMLEFHLRRRKDLKCDVCNNRYCSYGKLEEHVKTHMPKQEKISMSRTNDALIKRVMQNSEIEIALVRDEKKTVVKEESLKKPEIKEIKATAAPVPKEIKVAPVAKEVKAAAPVAPPVVEQKCPLCGKVMGKRDVLNDHITTHLKRVGEYFRCKDCDCKYLYPIYLVRHYKNRKVSQCELCQKVFCSDLNLANHECPGQSLKRQRTQSVSSEMKFSLRESVESMEFLDE
uniref:C2H2-type domain-containing protein n=1 Tax=Phlebotomus papatasi TaxID=29031 RepID=A0A1B0D2I2_PHLPP